MCFLGQGVILDPDHFVEELRLFKEKIPDPIIYLSSNISLILDYHKKLDKINESILVKLIIPNLYLSKAYQDKVGRKSIKLADLSDSEILDSKLNNVKSFYDPILIAFGENPIDLNEYKKFLFEKLNLMDLIVIIILCIEIDTKKIL